MNILIVPSWYPNENKADDIYGIFFKELAEAMAAEGHEVSVLANLLPYPLNIKKWPDFLRRKSFYVQNNVKTFNHKFLNWSGYKHIDDSSSIKAALKWFERYNKKYKKPDIIHAHSIFNGGIIANAISKKYSIPYVITEHGSWFLKGIPEHKKGDAQKVFDSASVITSVSQGLLDKLFSAYTISKNKSYVIPNVLSSLFYVKTKKTRIDTKFVFLNIALDGQNKRRDLLINAFAKAFQGNKQFELWIGGTIHENAALINQANNLFILDQIKLLGLLTHEQTRQAMADCDVFVSSSDVETFGIVLIEALSQGKPVISTNSGGPKDIINERNGLLVPVDNVYELAHAMQEISCKINNYNSNLIRETCINKYNSNTIIQTYIDLFKTNIEAFSDRRKKNI